MRVRIQQSTYDALVEYNLRTSGRGVDSPTTEFHNDGTVSFDIDIEVRDRLKLYDGEYDAALRYVLGLTKRN